MLTARGKETLTPIPAGNTKSAVAHQYTASPISQGQRVFDLVVATIGLGLYAPFFLLAALLILLEDGRPIFFVQQRLGRKRIPFSVIKLRTMRDGCITRVGRWLRATGLDETVQFINVLLGTMRMVGPRPLTADDVERLAWDSPVFDVRFLVPPGITGLAQLFGGVSARHSFRLDRIYLRHNSLLLDLQLIVLSFAANLLGKHRVRAAMRWLRCRRQDPFCLCSLSSDESDEELVNDERHSD